MWAAVGAGRPAVCMPGSCTRKHALQGGSQCREAWPHLPEHIAAGSHLGVCLVLGIVVGVHQHVLHLQRWPAVRYVGQVGGGAHKMPAAEAPEVHAPKPLDTPPSSGKPVRPSQPASPCAHVEALVLGNVAAGIGNLLQVDGLGAALDGCNGGQIGGEERQGSDGQSARNAGSWQIPAAVWRASRCAQ